MEENNKKEIEKQVKEYFNSLNPEQLTQLKQEFENGIDEIIKTNTEKLLALKEEKSTLELEKKELGSGYGDWDKKEAINKKINIINTSILNQENVIKCFENGGVTVNITDQKGHVYESIPDFRKVDTTQFDFNEDNILTEPTPKYVPFIDEEKFRFHGYVFDAIRVTEDSYAICLNYYTHKEKNDNIFIIVTLDQLVLIIDYYTTRARAKNVEEANRLNERSKKQYYELSEERRRYYMFQKGIYSSLSSANKKKISQSDFENLDLEGREKYYLPIKTHAVKRIVSRLNEGQMYKSFHRMYEDLINDKAQLMDKHGNISANGGYANPIVSKYWREFTEMINYKLKDIKIQREDYSETYKQAVETSFGESNVDPILKEKYGILVKRQNGDKIKPNEIELIRNSWVKIQGVYGNLKAEAIKHNLKISHSGEKLMFAMKALGVYIPQMGTIGVSNKLGEIDFKSTFSHEVAHFIDNFIGKLNGKRWATDDYESLAGKIAFKFRNSMNKPKSDQTDYINATKECFARAFQQYFGMKTEGEDVLTMNVDAKISTTGIEINKHPNFVNKFTFKDEIAPMIEQFLKENLDVFETTVDLDGTNDLAPITKEQGFEPFINGFEYKILKSGIEGSDKEIFGIEVYYNKKFQFGYAYIFESAEEALNKMLKRISNIRISSRYFQVRTRWRLMFTNNGVEVFKDFESEDDLKSYRNDLQDLIEYSKKKILDKPFVIESKGWDYVNKSISERKNILKQMESDLEEREKKLKIELNQEESITDLIEGLKVLAEVSSESEKAELLDLIEGLEVLLDYK